MTTWPCVRCERPSATNLCTSCWQGLAPDIAMLGWLDHQLTIARTRQARLGGNTSSTGETPLGYGYGAARAQDALRTVVTTWARDFSRAAYGQSSIAGCAALLLDEQAVRRHPAAAEIVRDLERVRDRALRSINPAEELPTYGLCGAETHDPRTGDTGICEAYLYGDADASWVRCRACRTQHETRDRREWMRRRLEVLYFRAATLARLLPLLIDRPVSADQIRTWVRDGRPIGADQDDDGFPTYRCGDVITVALTTPRRARRAEGSVA